VTPTRADIAPPPGYVEECTIEKVQKKGEYCAPCQAWHGDTELCTRTFEGDKQKWSRRCRAGGASVWTEIWCTKWTGKDPPPVPKPKTKPKPSESSPIIPPVF
jgi:hypothetical protein